MAHSIWQKTLVTGLAWASFGWAQQPPGYFTNPVPDSAQATASERVITVQENGKASHKCKVVKSWQTPDDATAYKVQALDTGEIMTIVESGPITSVPGAHAGTRMHAVATRIFHWSNTNTPPAEAPAPPHEVTQAALDTSLQPAAVPSEPSRVSSPAATPEIVEERAGVLSRWMGKSRRQEVISSADACVCPPGLPAPTAGPAATPQVVEERGGMLSKLAGKSQRQEIVSASDIYASQPNRPTSPSRPYRMSDTWSQPTRVVSSSSPYSPNTSSASTISSIPVTTSSSPVNGSPMTAGDHTMSSSDCCQSTAPVNCNDHKVLILPPLKMNKDSLVTVVNDCCDAPATHKDSSSAGLLNKWRESWGKADDHRSLLRKSDKPLLAETPAVGLPAAEMRKPDPLQAPEKYVAGLEDEMPSKLRQAQLSGKNQQPPLGAQSVVGAAGGMGNQVQFVPVPIVTVPDLTRPPMPPMHAPQPVPQQNSGMAYAGPASKALGPNMTTTDEGMVNAFTSMPSRDQVALASNAFTNGESAGGNGSSQMLPPAAMPMYPRSPYATMAHGASNMMPSAPMNQGVMPVGYQVPMQVSAAMPSGAAEQQMLMALRDSLYPSQREWAVEGLATFDWHAHPEVVQALLAAARQDPAATVRAACAHHLAKMNVNTMPVVDVIQKLKADSDPRVRQQADQAMSVLQPALPPMKSMVEPAGAWSPRKFN